MSSERTSAAASKPELGWVRRKLIFWLLPKGYQLIRRETPKEMSARVNAPFADYDRKAEEHGWN